MLRAFIEGFTGVLIIDAFKLMPIADLTAILLAQPFMMTIVGVWLFGERPGWRGWRAVTAGFLGMLLVIKPGTGSFDQASLIGHCRRVSLGSRLAHAKDPRDMPTPVVTGATAVVAVLIGVCRNRRRAMDNAGS